jgi:predicted amidohydrolase YtcJ
MPADTIIINAKILTMDDARPRAEAVAFHRGAIVAVGDNDDARFVASPGATVIDAAGASVLPGFIEGHLHLFAGAAELAHLQLGEVKGHEALTAAIRDYAATRKADPLLMAQGAVYTILSDHERIDRHLLDAIIPDQPFMMAAADHHTVWANTIALERAGLLKGKALGPGNEVVMGADGLANGELREMEAFQPVFDLAGGRRERFGLSTGGEPEPPSSPAEWRNDLEIMKQGLAYCAEHGITSVQNMDGNLYQLDLLEAVEKEGELLCRVEVPFHFKNFMDIGMLDKASMMAKRYDTDWIKSGYVKLFFDGVLEGWTAIMVEPYCDRPQERPNPLFTPERFKELAIEIDRRGLQIAVHAIGDGAVKAVLDGYEAAALKNGRRDSRHRIEHIEVVHPSDIPRFKALGVIASMQPRHCPGTLGLPLEPILSAIGPKRCPYAYAWQTLREAGARLVFATDWPVSPIDPMASIEAAMTRPPLAPGLKDERQTLHNAIAAYTRDGAHAEFMEHRKGMIREGMMADCVILSGDLEKAAPEGLAAIRPVTTICGGRITYQR